MSYGMSFVSNGPEHSKHGLVLVSINHTLKVSSIIKSNPKSSKEFSLLLGSNLPFVALN